MDRLMKKCSTCKIEKELIEFSKDKNRKDGLQNECKFCNKEYYTDNKEQIKNRIKEYNKEYYNNNRDQIKEYYTDNKEQIKNRIKEYQVNNKDQIKEYQKEYNRRPESLFKSRIKNSTRRSLTKDKSSVEDVNKLFDIQNNQCLYCSCDLTETKYHIDHIHPISKGGSNLVINLCLACPTCNLSKNAKDIIDWCFYINIHYDDFMFNLNIRNETHFFHIIEDDNNINSINDIIDNELCVN